jgi:hypothetical protein
VLLATALAIVVNLVTNGGGWWLWPVLGALVLAVIVAEVRRDRQEDRLTMEPSGASYRWCEEVYGER